MRDLRTDVQKILEWYDAEQRIPGPQFDMSKVQLGCIVEGLRLALAAAPVPTPGLVWKPFETAPRDGHEFLVIYPLQGNVYKIVRFNKLWKQWESKGVYLTGIEHQDCLWCPLPEPKGA